MIMFASIGEERTRTVPSWLSNTIKWAFPLSGLALMTSAAWAQPASTYDRSCRHIQVTGKTLSAECRRSDGNYKQATLPIAGIDNVGGRLRFTSMYRASSFQDSCKDIRVDRKTLFATCRRPDGGFTRSSIRIPGIENLDGDLRYR